MASNNLMTDGLKYIKKNATNVGGVFVNIALFRCPAYNELYAIHTTEAQNKASKMTSIYKNYSIQNKTIHLTRRLTCRYILDNVLTPYMNEHNIDVSNNIMWSNGIGEDAPKHLYNPMYVSVNLLKKTLWKNMSQEEIEEHVNIISGECGFVNTDTTGTTTADGFTSEARGLMHGAKEDIAKRAVYFRKEYETLKTMYDEAKNENKDLKKTVNIKAAVISKLQTDVNTLKNDKETLVDQNMEIKEKNTGLLSNLSSSIHLNKVMSKEIDDLRIDVANATKEHWQKVDEISNANDHAEKLEKIIKDLQIKNTTLTKKNKALTKEKHDMIEKIEDLTEEKTKMSDQIEDLTEEKNNMTEKIEDLTEEKNTLTDTLESLKKALDAITNSIF